MSRSGLQAYIVRAPANAEDTTVAVSCGRALFGERIAIVEPETGKRLPPDRVGEIWVNGANTARAYWRNCGASALLTARISGDDAGASVAADRRSWLL